MISNSELVEHDPEDLYDDKHLLEVFFYFNSNQFALYATCNPRFLLFLNSNSLLFSIHILYLLHVLYLFDLYFPPISMNILHVLLRIFNACLMPLVV